MRQELLKQNDFVGWLHALTVVLQQAKPQDRQKVLSEELSRYHFDPDSPTRIPAKPSIQVAGIDTRHCKIFNSRTVRVLLSLVPSSFSLFSPVSPLASLSSFSCCFFSVASLLRILFVYIICLCFVSFPSVIYFWHLHSFTNPSVCAAPFVHYPPQRRPVWRQCPYYLQIG